MSETPQKSGVSALLIVSLCFNFFFAGIVVLGMLRAIGPRHFPVPARQLLMPQAIKLLLGDDDQSKLDGIIAAHRTALAKDRTDAFEARNDVYRDFGASVFDTSKYTADLDRMQKADATLEAESVKAMSETATALTPQQRERIAERLRRELWLAHWKREP